MLSILAIWVLKEKFTLKKALGLLFSFLGVYIIATRGALTSVKFQHPLGNFLALCTALVVAIYFAYHKKYNYERITSLFLYYLSAFLAAFIATIIFSYIPKMSLWIWLGMAWNGLFIFAIAYIFFFNALQIEDTTKISNLTYLVPFVSLIYIYFFLKEPIFISSIIGLVFIIIGIIILHLKTKESAQVA